MELTKEYEEEITVTIYSDRIEVVSSADGVETAPKTFYGEQATNFINTRLKNGGVDEVWADEQIKTGQVVTFVYDNKRYQIIPQLFSKPTEQPDDVAEEYWIVFTRDGYANMRWAGEVTQKEAMALAEEELTDNCMVLSSKDVITVMHKAVNFGIFAIEDDAAK